MPALDDGGALGEVRHVDGPHVAREVLGPIGEGRAGLVREIGAGLVEQGSACLPRGNPRLPPP